MWHVHKVPVDFNAKDEHGRISLGGVLTEVAMKRWSVRPGDNIRIHDNEDAMDANVELAGGKLVAVPDWRTVFDIG